jgi:hypothetical protein
MAKAHVSNDNFKASWVLAYVYLENAVHSPHLLVRQAMEQVCGAPQFHLVASSRGVGIMVFATSEECEQVVTMSPINYDGNNITVERHKEADNCFYAFYNVYAEIAVVDFPLEHWEEPLATEALGAIGNVCCIDPVASLRYTTLLCALCCVLITIVRSLSSCWFATAVVLPPLLESIPFVLGSMQTPLQTSATTPLVPCLPCTLLLLIIRLATLPLKCLLIHRIWLPPSLNGRSPVSLPTFTLSATEGRVCQSGRSSALSY